MEKSDLILLEQIISKRDEEAFRILYDRYATPLLTYLGSRIQPSNASEDVLHDIYMEIWDSGEEVQRKCGDNLKAWLFSRAKSMMSGHLKKSYRMVRMENISNQEEMEMAVSNVLDEIDFEELVQVIDKVVEGLPFHLQQIYQLRVRHRYTVEKTAKMLSLSENTVYTKTSELMSEFRSKLEIHLSTSANGVVSSIIIYTLFNNL